MAGPESTAVQPFDARFPPDLLSRVNEIISASERAAKGPNLTPKEIAETLQGRLAAFETPHIFKRGDLVQWKKGLKNRIRPPYNQPAIVLEVFPHPVFDEAEPHEADAREPIDLQLGVLMEDGGFAIFHFDKRRFEPFSGV